MSFVAYANLQLKMRLQRTSISATTKLRFEVVSGASLDPRPKDAYLAVLICKVNRFPQVGRCAANQMLQDDNTVAFTLVHVSFDRRLISGQSPGSFPMVHT